MLALISCRHTQTISLEDLVLRKQARTGMLRESLPLCFGHLMETPMVAVSSKYHVPSEMEVAMNLFDAEWGKDLGIRREGYIL